MKFAVYKYTEHSLRSKKGYINSYRFECEKVITHSFDYYARNTFPQQSVITTSDNIPLTVKPDGQKRFRNELVFSLNDNVIGFYDLGGKIIFDKTHVPLIYLVDPSSMLKSLLTAVMQGDPDTYQLLDKSKNVSYGHIFRKKLNSRFFWPFSIIDKLIKIIFTSNKRALYEIETTALPIEKEVLMIVSVILEEHKQSSRSAT